MLKIALVNSCICDRYILSQKLGQLEKIKKMNRLFYLQNADFPNFLVTNFLDLQNNAELGLK